MSRHWQALCAEERPTPWSPHLPSSPLALLLIALAEVAGAPAIAIYVLAAALLVAHFASAWGLSHSRGPTAPRQAGAGLTGLVVAAASLAILLRLAAGA